MKKIIALALCATLAAGLTACKGFLGEEDDALETQMELYGTLYYQREYFCSLTDDCADEADDAAVLDEYNDDNAEARDDEDYVDNDGDGSLEIIAVYVDDDDVPDMLIVDSDGDGRYDQILRAGVSGQKPKNTADDSNEDEDAGKTDCVHFANGTYECGIFDTYCGNIPKQYCQVDCGVPGYTCDAFDIRIYGTDQGAQFIDPEVKEETEEQIIDPVICRRNPHRC